MRYLPIFCARESHSLPAGGLHHSAPIPDCQAEDQSLSARCLALLDQVIGKQIDLIVAWMRVGFIHGVMNTDNTAISGETIDFGPCAMMGTDLQAVFGSIDQQGRYAFGNQPHMAYWKCRASRGLLMLVEGDDKDMMPKVEAIISGFAERFEAAYTAMMSRKLGLLQPQQGDDQLINALLILLDKQLDYTLTFDHLLQSIDNETIDSNVNRIWLQRTRVLRFKRLLSRWQARIQQQDIKQPRV